MIWLWIAVFRASRQACAETHHQAVGLVGLAFTARGLEASDAAVSLAHQVAATISRSAIGPAELVRTRLRDIADSDTGGMTDPGGWIEAQLLQICLEPQ